MAKQVYTSFILLLLLLKTETYLAEDTNFSYNKIKENKVDDVLDHGPHHASEESQVRNPGNHFFSSSHKCKDCHDEEKDNLHYGKDTFGALIGNHYEEKHSQEQIHSALTSNQDYNFRNDIRSSYQQLKRRHNITTNATIRQMMIKPFSGSIVGDIKHKWRDEDKEEEGKKDDYSKKDDDNKKDYDDEEKSATQNEHGHEEHGSFHKSHEDQEPFDNSHEEHEPFHKSHEDHESFHKSHEDHESFHKSHENHEPFHKSHEEHDLFHKPHDEHESFHKSHEPGYHSHNPKDLHKKGEDDDDWPIDDIDKDHHFEDDMHDELDEEEEKVFDDHGGGFEEEDEEEEFAKDHFDDMHHEDELDKDMDMDMDMDEEIKRHHRNQGNQFKVNHEKDGGRQMRHNKDHYNSHVSQLNENSKNEHKFPIKDANEMNHDTEAAYEEKRERDGMNRNYNKQKFNEEHRNERENQNNYNPVQSFVDKTHHIHEADNDYLNNAEENMVRRIEREEGMDKLLKDGQLTMKYDVQKSKVESVKKDAADPYSSIEDLKVDDNEGPDDAPSGKKKHLPGELVWNKDMPYKDITDRNNVHSRHHFHEFTEFSKFPKFGELGKGKSHPKGRHDHHGEDFRENGFNHPDTEYHTQGHIKGEIRNYDDEYDSLEHDDEDHKMSHKKQSHYEAIEHLHDGIEKFGKDDEEVIINDRTHQGDINEMEIVNRLTDPKASLMLAGIARSHHKVHDIDNRFDREPEYLNHELKPYGTKTSRGMLGNSAKDGGGEFYENNPNVYPHEFSRFNRPYSPQSIQNGQYGKRRSIKYNPSDTIVGDGFNGETTFKSLDQAEDIFKKMREVVNESSPTKDEDEKHSNRHVARGKRENVYGNTLNKIESKLKKIRQKIFLKSAFQKQLTKV